LAKDAIHQLKDGKKRKRVKAETWIKLAIRLDEIKQTPNDVLAQLTEDNSKLCAAVEEICGARDLQQQQ